MVGFGWRGPSWAAGEAGGGEGGVKGPTSSGARGRGTTAVHLPPQPLQPQQPTAADLAERVRRQVHANFTPSLRKIGGRVQRAGLAPGVKPVGRCAGGSCGRESMGCDTRQRAIDERTWEGLQVHGGKGWGSMHAGGVACMRGELSWRTGAGTRACARREGGGWLACLVCAVRRPHTCGLGRSLGRQGRGRLGGGQGIVGASGAVGRVTRL